MATIGVDIEEGRDVYHPGGFHPVYINDVYHGRYKVLNKIGYGVYSTVWLVRDLHRQNDETLEFLALKVLSAECYGTDHDIFEVEILKHLRDGDRELLGYKHICHLIDDFEHVGPNGTHVCLVFELMGETMNTFQGLFPESRIPNPIARLIAIQLCLALDYTHDYNVIHTDIKQTNIFVRVRDYSLIESGYLANVPVPEQDRTEEKYSVVPSHSLGQYYFQPGDNLGRFEFVLGDWGVSSFAHKHLCQKIQPVALRAPEVLIGAPWDKNADWWNLGALLLEMVGAIRMFSGAAPPDGHYEVKEHLNEMVDLFGPFPRSFLDKGDPQIVDAIFDNEGKVKDACPMDRPGLLTDTWTPGLDAEVREKFITVLKAMMKIDPSERGEAEDYLRLPWLGVVE